jgi:tetratricopeptide (TPR) repeat protein
MGRSTESHRPAGHRETGHGMLARIVLAGLFTAVTGGVAAAQAVADATPLAAAYGGGVHAYFAGDYLRSHDLLSDAIGAGIAAPRAWYYRGLAALRLGRTDEAEADFAEGAERESSRVAQWPVSRSLERVQGADRLQLERHRVRARVAALGRHREAERRRYSDIDDARSEVLRGRRPRGASDAADAPFADPAVPEAIPVPGDDAAADGKPGDEPLTLENDPFETK